MKKKHVLLSLCIITGVYSVAVFAGGANEPEFFPMSRYTRVSFDIHGPVLGGESLWPIANSLSISEGVNIDNAMMSLFKLNPGAFSNGNINCLKKGALLMIPDLPSLLRLSGNGASERVKRHHDQWVEMQRRCSQ